MSRPVVRALIAIAALALVAALLIPSRSSSAFGDMINTIVDAKTAKFQVTVTNDVQPNQFKDVKATAYFALPARFRQEFGDLDMVTIADMQNGKMLSLMTKQKQAMVFNIENLPKNGKQAGNDFFGNLRNVLAEYRTNKQGQLEELGEKEIDGHRAFGMRLSSSGLVQTLWGDVKTGQVLRIESRYNGPPKTEVVMSQFEFNVPLDDALFALDVPEGYSETSVPIDATPATEADFIAALKQLSDATEGTFPASLDTPGITKAMVTILKDKSQEDAMKQGVKIGRGMNFAIMLPAESDPHYAGKDAKQTGPKQPIFWYKPTGQNAFRVIYSDLSTGEATAAPNVPGAIRMVEPLPGGKGK